MPFGPYEDFDACVADNSDKNNPEAYCAAIKQEVEGADLSEEEQRYAEEDPCEDGYVMVGTKQQNGQTVPNCVPEEDADEANLSHHILSAGGNLSDRIERTEESDNKVRYRNISLLSEGVWTDEASKTPTLYGADAFEKIEPEFDESEFDGPPVNEMHDVDSETGEVNETSLAGFVDPDSLHVAGKTLRGDIVLETDDPAGEIADERLQDALESGGRVGYGGPSVELDLDPQTDIEPSDHPRAEKEINAAQLTGLGLVSNQADKNIGFSQETAHRAVALSGQDALILEREKALMDAEELRETLEGAGIDTEDMEDEDVMDMAESLHGDLMEQLEMGDYEDGEEEDEDDEDKEMMDDGTLDMVQEEMDDLWGEMDEMKAMIEEMQDQMATEEEMSEAREELSENIEDAKAELAEAETVEELADAKDELDKRLSSLEDEPDNSDRTLSEDESWEPEYDNSGVSGSPSW